MAYTLLTLAADLDIRPGGESRNGETLSACELDEGQAQSIEPDLGRYLGRAVNAERLPAGQYCFTQVRKKLDRAELAALAAEQQKDALWERVALAPYVYFRSLREDGSDVSQVLRPVIRRGPDTRESACAGKLSDA
jgi:hypothetical protein